MLVFLLAIVKKWNWSALVTVLRPKAKFSNFRSVSHTQYISNFPKKLRLKLKLRETRTLSSSLKVATSNFSVKCVQKFVHSASPNLTKVKVSSLLVKSFAASLVNRLVLSN